MSLRWITLESLQRENGGYVCSLTIAEHTRVNVEASPKNRDIRVTAGDHVAKVVLSESWMLQQVLVDDVVVWTAGEDASDDGGGEE